MADARPHPVDIVGMVGGEVFGTAAHLAVATADVLVGSVRHLAHTTRAPKAERLELTSPLPVLFDSIDEHRCQGRRVCLLASGDPGFFGITRSLADHLGPTAVRVHPAPSSVALAFATQGWSWDDAIVASAHGRALAPAIAAVASAPKAAVLTDPTNPPEAVGSALLRHGPEREVVVVSRIGERDESVHHTDLAGLAAGHFDPMSVVLLRDRSRAVAAEPTSRRGRSEDAFAHRDGMITKAEVRAVALGKLALRHTGVLWDVGAGSGSVGIEAAALAPRLQVFSIEREVHDAERIVANAAAHHASITVVTGNAPDALADLPDPDRVFIGGGGIDVLDECLRRLAPHGVVVATYVLLDRALAAHARLGNMIQVRVDRCVPLGALGVRMEPLNPVFVCWGPA
ncbi:MAG TPA: precorrin-6y C5,15-methyltransferase (decarboxylating) subunit CbiE [Acidimicrobiales bacterium]|nr:precorrin-6y C5,15-methyltransferase (decarboxylating) subunit CbiE [Acidimicrobiales bacterium]